MQIKAQLDGCVDLTDRVRLTLLPTPRKFACVECHIRHACTNTQMCMQCMQLCACLHVCRRVHSRTMQCACISASASSSPHCAGTLESACHAGVRTRCVLVSHPSSGSITGNAASKCAPALRAVGANYDADRVCLSEPPMYLLVGDSAHA